MGECRALYVASNGNRYAVIAGNVYAIDYLVNFTLLGTLGGTIAGPVSMVDNGLQLVIVDGTGMAYYVTLKTNVMTAINDPAFYGASKVDFVDGYFIFNKPNSQQWYISKYLDVTFDSLDLASKSTYSDNLVTLAVMHREVWLFGELTTEVWYNTGASDFTFGRMPGVFIEHGCAAAASVAKIDLALFWLSKDLQGQAMVYMGKSYQANRVSTHALEQEFSTYSTISDARGFSYLQEGHAFYVLTFPTANRTWVYDTATGLWHQRAFLEADGSLSRHRMNCHAVVGSANLVGDWQTGAIHSLDPLAYTDNGAPIMRIRSFPHLVNQARRIFYHEFIADMEVGAGLPDNSDDPEIRLRWSDDRGASWSNPIGATLGRLGEFQTSIQYQRLGYARDRVFELSWTAPVKTALNGAWIGIGTSHS